MHYFFDSDLKNKRTGDVFALNDDETNHLFRILRAMPGDNVGLLDGHGNVAGAVVVEKRRLQITSLRSEEVPSLRLHLYLAPPRRQKMEQLLKQSAELGAFRIVTFFCERSVALPAGENSLKRREGLLMEACKQSGNPFLPVSDGPMDFADAVEDAKARCPFRCFGAPADPGRGMVRDLTGDCAFFVGPEGGFTEKEEQILCEAGFQPIRIGRRILRVETAAVAGLAVLAAAEKP